MFPLWTSIGNSLIIQMIHWGKGFACRKIRFMTGLSIALDLPFSNMTYQDKDQFNNQGQNEQAKPQLYSGLGWVKRAHVKEVPASCTPQHPMGLNSSPLFSQRAAQQWKLLQLQGNQCKLQAWSLETESSQVQPLHLILINFLTFGWS